MPKQRRVERGRSLIPDPLRGGLQPLLNAFPLPGAGMLYETALSTIRATTMREAMALLKLEPVRPGHLESSPGHPVQLYSRRQIDEGAEAPPDQALTPRLTPTLALRAGN
jgi:hypothetical protein